LLDPSIRKKAFAELTGISTRLECPVDAIGGVADHVHVLFRQSSKISISDWIREVKKFSTPTIKALYASLREFHWQGGYGAFSVDAARLDGVRAYIRGQEEHHKTRSFKDEYIALLVEHNMAWDEKYVWD